MGEASEQKSLVLPSKEVVGLTTWSFVKFYGRVNRSKYLVRYIILYSVTLPKSFQFWYFSLVLLWLFEISTKVGDLAYSLQKIDIVYSSILGMQPPIWIKS